MLRVGLTGGIGAGKSAVSARLAELGAVIIDADRLAREVVAPGTDGLAEIVAAFGDGILGADGGLDRPALGAKVFGDEPARRRLEQIIHPRVRARTAEMIEEAPAGAIVVNDVPLLVETGLAPTYHLVVVVTANREVRIGRLVRDRGMSAAEAAARIGAQADDATRQAAADVILPNEDDLAALRARVDALWRDRLLPFERNVRAGTAARKAPELHIVPPDPGWPQAAERLITRIRHQLGDADVRHIGSTAVPGLPAKDIIDLMLSVRTLDEADALAGRLAAAGFPARSGEWADNARGLPGQTWPKRVHGSSDPGRPVILHVRVAGSPGWRFALLMRDHLRAVPAARDAYAAAKAELALRFPDRAGYAAAKEPWFDEEAAAAEAWATATGWQPAAGESSPRAD
ncbi:dephospho-CoA kinase [Actinoplanes sp. SE50]|uniref:dephospho-CoA kinase n=1 Tax=unclassified Actinoplanes TaxID=2626549 RepID=UPI00023ED001|nr:MULTISPECIES: dephospho-CoA kinase [unclassified Actinoplanes]AEV82730.1 dephospho-CoA kinase/unknown domain fusion protein [Actinoplanes sp. SE50/110]ATO81126.1 dephospho-CoA kinase [Actinoplanes sp. SE50]SLL98533.1 dephospho-CoA kinase [Actinoplanes sp. SE50/110]